MRNLVTVAITTYDRHDLLERAICSVLSQQYGEWEGIVVDDCPENPARQVVKKHGEDNFRYILHEENKGLSAARNTGLRHAKGDMIAFLDDDDEWLPGKLQRQVQCMKKAQRDVALVHCWMETVSDGDVVETKCPEFKGDIFEHTLDRQPLGNGSTWLLRRSALLEKGGFDASLPRGIDGDLLRRLCKTHKVDYVPDILVRYRVGHDHERITQSDREGLRNAIAGQKVKLEKFKTELKALPRQRARIYSRIAYRYGQLNDWKNCFSHFQCALRSDPCSMRTFRDAAKLFIDTISNKGI